LSHIEKLRELTGVMVSSSFCGLGVSVANPFNSIIDNFFDEFRPKRRRRVA
jgi:NADH:ubiquinone oxidoreductase subunit F (NADH-binding)